MAPGVFCLAGWSTVAFPFAETGRRSGVRVAEPGLSPHSSCWQRDVRCLGFYDR